MLAHNPTNKMVAEIILENTQNLQDDPDTALLFKEPHFVIYWQNKNIKDVLVRSELNGWLYCRAHLCNQNKGFLFFQWQNTLPYKSNAYKMNNINIYM